MSNIEVVDVLVIGGGPAGLSAALNLGIARRRTLVINDDTFRNKGVTLSHGLLTHEGKNPTDIRSQGRADLIQYSDYVSIIDDSTVTALVMHSNSELSAELHDAIDAARPPTKEAGTGTGTAANVSAIQQRVGFKFEATIQKSASASSSSSSSASSSSSPSTTTTRVLARAIVLASGLIDHFPEIPGFKEEWDHSVIVCPFCQAHDRRDDEWAFVAAGIPKMPLVNMMLPMMRTFSSSLTALIEGPLSAEFTDADRTFLKQTGINVVESKMTAIKPIEQLAGSGKHGVEVTFADGSTKQFRVIVTHPHTSVSPIVSGLGLAPSPANFGGIETKLFHATAVDGVYACGDLSDPRGRLAGAMATGADAGAGAHLYLAQLEYRRAAAAAAAAAVAASAEAGASATVAPDATAAQ